MSIKAISTGGIAAALAAVAPALMPLVVDRVVYAVFKNQRWAAAAGATAVLGIIAMTTLTHQMKAIVALVYLVFKGCSVLVTSPKAPLSNVPKESKIKEPKIKRKVELTSLEINQKIFSYLGPKELRNCLYVNTLWLTFANDEAFWKPFYHDIAFGKEQWERYMGKIDQEPPPLPRNIFHILDSPCPTFPDKKVHETHILVLVPQTVNGEPLTMKLLEKLTKSPKKGHAASYRYCDLGAYKDTPAPASHWVLMMRTVIPKSRGLSYLKQQQLAEDIANKAQVLYEIPNLLDATVSILMDYVPTGISQYGNNPSTYTRTTDKYNEKWQLTVGGLFSGGFDVNYVIYDFKSDGVSLLRKS